MKKTILLLATAMASTMAIAQDTPKFEIRPTGRILIDGALYASPQKSDFKDGVAIPDARLGVKMKYGKWDAKIDVGFAYNKVGLKDLYIGYNFNDKSLIRVGSFIHQYGLQSATSSSMKCTMEEPVSNAVFNDSRQLGVMYVYYPDKFLITASAHAEPSATTVILTPDQFTQEGYGFRSRMVYRPIHSDGVTVQVGVSGGFASPQRHADIDGVDVHDGFQFKSNFPTRVSQVTALNAVVDHSMNLWKFTPELLLSYGRVALESQYFYNQVNRRNNLHHFTGQGAYAIARGLLFGDTRYGYSLYDGGLTTPGPKTLECVLGYNYTKLSDAKAGIFGGRMNDFSVTFNYYINKYMTARLHYSYTHTWDRAGQKSMTLNGFMARLQVLF